MTLNKLNAISPVDGRYNSKTKELKPFFSEESLIRYRVKIEIEYFIALCEIPLPQLSEVTSDLYAQLRNIYKNFTEADALAVKANPVRPGNLVDITAPPPAIIPSSTAALVACKASSTLSFFSFISTSEGAPT